jgi:hypothetical protein
MINFHTPVIADALTVDHAAGAPATRWLAPRRGKEDSR